MVGRSSDKLRKRTSYTRKRVRQAGQIQSRGPHHQPQRSRGRALADRPDAAAQAAETRERRQASLQAKKAPRPTKAAAADPFYRSAVCDVYAQHAPERLPEVDEILGRWAGREQQLLMKLHKKYGRTMSRPTK